MTLTDEGLERRVHAYALRHADTEDARTLAQTWMRNLTKRDLALLAEWYVAHLISLAWRERARATEQRAERGQPSAPAETSTQQRRRERDEWCQRLFEEPHAMTLNSKDRTVFRSWCGPRFQDWLSRARAMCLWETIDDNPEERCPCDPCSSRSRDWHWWCAREALDMDWHEYGWNGYRHEQAAREVRRLVEAVAESVRLEVTAELLQSSFALGDGQRVTWGEATVDQHRQRIRMLQASAVGTVETAARHAAAVRMLQDAHASTLGSLKTEAA